jgi:3-phosphoglycerate kinase
MKTLEDIHALYDKKVLMRVDFNVPFYETGEIADDTRIRAHIPTLAYLIKAGAKVALISHIGNSERSLQPVAERLSFLMKDSVTFIGDCLSPHVHETMEDLGEGSIVLLENTRMYKEEKENDDAFSKKLANGFDLFINDAFATAHRKHASTYGVAEHIENKCAGLLMQTEVDTLTKLLESPKHPFLVMIGGAKVSSKLNVLRKLVTLADTLLIGGAMANTFLKATGIHIGQSLYEENMLKEALNILQIAKAHDCKVILPSDVTVADTLEKNVFTENPNVNDIPEDKIILDIGKHTQAVWAEMIKDAATLLWNGPCGVFEVEPFHLGTEAVAQAVAKSKAFTIIGGGDTLHAAELFKVQDKIDYVSTGGGSLLQFLEGKPLPALEVLK